MLKLDIEEIREAIRGGRFTNEAAVCQGVVLRILHALSWPIHETQIVSPEYSVEGRRVDFALCHPERKPKVFIEVKKVGHSDAAAEKQLFRYAFDKGIPMAILTDGQEWQFFLHAEEGDFGERRVYLLDIVEREIDETALGLSDTSNMRPFALVGKGSRESRPTERRERAADQGEPPSCLGTTR